MTKVENSLDPIQVYVGTYKKYNEGSIYGKWLKISDFAGFAELQNAMCKLHQDEQDPEFMIQDFQTPQLIIQMELISECGVSPEIYNVIEKIKDSDYDIEVWEAFIDCFGNYQDLDEILNRIEGNYQGEYSSDEDFAEELLTNSDSIPSNLPSYIYIDWERTARDIMFDYSESNNHYFRNF